MPRNNEVDQPHRYPELVSQSLLGNPTLTVSMPDFSHRDVVQLGQYGVLSARRAIIMAEFHPSFVPRISHVISLRSQPKMPEARAGDASNDVNAWVVISDAVADIASVQGLEAFGNRHSEREFKSNAVGVVRLGPLPNCGVSVGHDSISAKPASYVGLVHVQEQASFQRNNVVATSASVGAVLTTEFCTGIDRAKPLTARGTHIVRKASDKLLMHRGNLPLSRPRTVSAVAGSLCVNYTSWRGWCSEATKTVEGQAA